MLGIAQKFEKNTGKMHSKVDNIYKPSSLKRLLHNLEVKPRKFLSQNFLIDQNILKKIVHIAEVKPGDLVLEIGPGPGALTEILLKEGAKVIAIEKDRELAKNLINSYPQLEVLSKDILSCDLSLLFKGKQKAKVISNLPYHLTAPILACLLPKRSLFSSLTLMLQKEVGERIVAGVGTKEYSSFSLFCQYYAKVSYRFTISPNSFFPKPKVHSALIHFALKENDQSPFYPSSVIREAFGQKRKMLRASLSKKFGKENVENILAKCNLSPTARPQELTLSQFISLALILDPQKFQEE